MGTGDKRDQKKHEHIKQGEYHRDRGKDVCTACIVRSEQSTVFGWEDK